MSIELGAMFNFFKRSSKKEPPSTRSAAAATHNGHKDDKNKPSVRCAPAARAADGGIIIDEVSDTEEVTGIMAPMAAFRGKGRKKKNAQGAKGQGQGQQNAADDAKGGKSEKNSKNSVKINVNPTNGGNPNRKDVKNTGNPPCQQTNDVTNIELPEEPNRIVIQVKSEEPNGRETKEVPKINGAPPQRPPKPPPIPCSDTQRTILDKVAVLNGPPRTCSVPRRTCE